MLYCLFKTKNKIKILIAWFILYFVPNFIMVHDGEENNLEMVQNLAKTYNHKKAADISLYRRYQCLGLLALSAGFSHQTRCGACCHR